MKNTVSKFMADRKNAKLQNEILQALIDRVPNGIKLHGLERLFPDSSSDELGNALEKLIDQGLILHQPIENKSVPGRILHAYRLTDNTKYPVRQTYTIGGIEFPRLMYGDLVGAEDFLEIFETLDQYSKSLEKRFEDLTSKMTRKYWINMATLFALFISVFSLVIKASEAFTITSSTTYRDLFLFKLAELSPLAIILFAFIIMLRLILRGF